MLEVNGATENGSELGQKTDLKIYKQKCAAYNLIKTGTFIQMLNLVYYLSHKAA